MAKDVKKAAEHYIAKGLQVVPLSKGKKSCRHADWMKLVFKPSDFKSDDNIGIRSVNGLVIIDEDSSEVIKIANEFLPVTCAIYGRKSKPRSKRLYYSDFEKILAYKDGNVTLIEIRSQHQDMAPPSVHPNGETLEWYKTGEATKVEKVVLQRAVQLLATCALIIRHYAPGGARHEWCLSLTGTLRQLQITEEEATHIITVAAEQVKDGKIVDRITELNSTYAKGENDPVAASKALEEASTKTFVSDLHSIWGAKTTGIPLEKIEELNKYHAVLFQQSGDIVVITEDKNKKEKLRFSSFEAIKQLYPQKIIMSRNARGVPVYQKLGQAWLESSKRRFYNGIELAPGKSTPHYYNLWEGFKFEPKHGSWQLYQRHIREVICDNDVDLYRYVISWMAQCVQHPNKPGYTALALRGAQGTGKSTFAEWFGKLFGNHFLHLDSTRQLTGHFNAHLHNCVVVFADEAARPGDKGGIGALRRMITEKTLAIERKGLDILTVKNVIHLIIASNSEWFINAAMAERRFAALDLSPAHQNDTEWFAAIDKELEGGGFEGLLYDLQKYEIDENFLRTIPQTGVLNEQKQASFSAPQNWWFQVLQEGEIWDTEHYGGGYLVDRNSLYDDYINALDRAGVRDKGLKRELAIFLSKMLPPEFPKVFRKYKQPRKWIIPDIKECREWFEGKVYGGELEWINDEEKEEEKIPF